MKKILLIFSISLITLLLSCKDDELLIDEVLEVTENSIKSGVLTSNQTWSSDTIYILQSNNDSIVTNGKFHPLMFPDKRDLNYLIQFMV